MTTTTAPKPAAPKDKAEPKTAPKPKATPKQVDNVPETDATPAPAPAAKSSKAGQNSAYAPENVRAKLAERLLQMREDGWTRPAISAIIDYTDSQVWRAFNLKAHTSEMETWAKFIQEVDAGTHKPPTSGRKPNPAELQARIDAALAKLANPDAKTAAQYRAVIAEAKAALEA